MRIVLAGNPNSGKTTLFNVLTGSRAKVANYPGVTVEHNRGEVRLPDGRIAEVVDSPGTYSLTARSPEEALAVDAIFLRAPRPSLVIVALDSTALARGLYFALQVRETGVPMVIALTMADEAEALGVRVDPEKLSNDLGAPVIEVVAPKKKGISELLTAVGDETQRIRESLRDALEEENERALETMMAAVRTSWRSDDLAEIRAYAKWALLSLGMDELEDVPAAVRSAAGEVNEKHPFLAREIIAARYRRIDEWLERAKIGARNPVRKGSERVDAVLMHPVAGLFVFAAVMALVFQSLFSWSEPAIATIEAGIGFLQGALRGALPKGPLADLLASGVVAGVGNVVVFVPQIALLSFFIALLEDSGYLARVAFVIDRVMGGVGLHGKAFVPMLSGYACAVPAIMATRTIESRRDRLLTMLAIPFTSCSARLPVYALVIAVVFPATARSNVLGFLSVGALVLLGMYLFSAIAALTAAAVMRRTILRGPRPTLILELPPYRMPTATNLLLATWRKVRAFLIEAGTLILALTILLWAAVTYPKDDAITREYASFRRDAAAITNEAERDAALVDIDHREAAAQIERSIAGRVGKAIEPALEPLGWDWRIGVGILGAFAAREVFVSTLGIVFGVGEDDEEFTPLRAKLQSATHPDGRKLLTPLSGLSLMIFFVLAAQCMSTLAIVKRESGSWKWSAFMLGFMTIAAYSASLLVFQLGRAMGFV